MSGREFVRAILIPISNFFQTQQIIIKDMTWNESTCQGQQESNFIEFSVTKCLRKAPFSSYLYAILFECSGSRDIC